MNLVDDAYALLYLCIVFLILVYYILDPIVESIFNPLFNLKKRRNILIGIEDILLLHNGIIITLFTFIILMEIYIN